MAGYAIQALARQAGTIGVGNIAGGHRHCGADQGCILDVGVGSLVVQVFGRSWLCILVMSGNCCHRRTV